MVAVLGAGVIAFSLIGGGDDSAGEVERSASAVAPGAAESSSPAALQRPPRRPPTGRDRPPSRAVGTPTDGRLVNGAPLPPDGTHFFTWNIPRASAPNPRFRRFATRTVIGRVRESVAVYRRANPGAARVGIADLSLPRGGEFGVDFGGTGHVGHQNGLDVDVLYPRRDRRERLVETLAEADTRLAQDLLDRFLEAGAVSVVLDGDLGLRGPRRALEDAAFHEEHMSVRFPRR